MSADRRKRGKPERPPGDDYRPSDLRAWAKYWDCSQQDVRDAAKHSGAAVEDMQDWLRINVVR